MVTGTLGAFAGFGQLSSMTETRMDKDLNIVSAFGLLVSPGFLFFNMNFTLAEHHSVLL